MKVEKKYNNFYITNEHLEKIEKILSSKGVEKFEYEFSLYYEDERIEIKSKTEFNNVTRYKGTPLRFWHSIECTKSMIEKIGKAEYPSDKTLFKIYLNSGGAYGGEISVKASNVEEVYNILEVCEKILDLKKFDTKLNKKTKTVFITHSFDDIGRKYGQIISNFMILLGFDVKSGEKYSPEKVETKIKRRFSSQQTLLVILSAKDDFTWLNQEIGGGAFTDKVIFILKEDELKIEEGILKGMDYIIFPKNNIEKSFIKILEGLDEINALDNNSE